MSVIETMVNSIDLFGFGADPMAWAFSALIALAVTQREIKEKKYTNTVVIFLSSWAVLIVAEMAKFLEFFVAMTIILSMGVILSERIKVKEA